MRLIDVWNITYNSQWLLIRLDGNNIFEGLMGDVPMKFMNYPVIWITSIKDTLIIDVLGDN